VPVRIRMKKMGKKARPFYRIVVVDARAPRDGKVIEELGHYDPMVQDTDARVELKRERVDYWLGVGAQPTEKTAVLIKKYGSKGTHLAKQEASVAKLKAIRNRRRPAVTRSQESSPAEAAAE
jgi:small subunit ribosomal protein S16